MKPAPARRDTWDVGGESSVPVASWASPDVLLPTHTTPATSAHRVTVAETRLLALSSNCTSLDAASAADRGAVGLAVLRQLAQRVAAVPLHVAVVRKARHRCRHQLDAGHSPLQVGEDYLLWIMRDGNTMSFGIDDETIDYLITTATYDPSPSSDGGNRTVVSGIQGSGTSDPSGADGFFRASVDNVYVGGPEASTGSSSWLTATHPLVVLQLIAIVLLRSTNRSVTHRVSS